MTIQEWKEGLEKEAGRYGLTILDVLPDPDDLYIQGYININVSPKEFMNEQAEDCDLELIY